MRSAFRLFRYPGLVVAVIGAGGVLALAGASGTLFVSSSASATLARNLDQLCPWGAGLSVGEFTEFFGAIRLHGRRLDTAALLSEEGRFLNATRTKYTGLDPPMLTLETNAIGASGTKHPHRFFVRLLTRPSAMQHVHVLSSAGGKGVWITDTTAARLGLKAGDTIKLRGTGFEFAPPGAPPPEQSPTGPIATVRVTGVYRDLASLPESDFWCSLNQEIYPPFTANNPFPPFVLTDQATLLDLARRMRLTGLQSWEFPLSSSVTLSQARAMAGPLDRLTNQQTDTGGPARFGPFRYPGLSTEVPPLVTQADGTVAAVRGPAGSISLAGRVVALVVVAAAGAYWVERRRTEIGLLAAKGVGPGGAAARAMLEAAVPLALASAGGWALAIVLVRKLGPSPFLDPGVTGEALRTVAVTAAVALVMMGLVAAAAAWDRAGAPRIPGRAGLAKAPWEVAVLGLAGASLYEILTRGSATIDTTSGAPKIDVLVLVFPILFVAGGAGLAVRLLRLLLPRLRRRRLLRRPALYLASRRLAGASKLALASMVAVALAVGILAYAGTLASSVSQSQRAKALVFIGSDLEAEVGGASTIPSSLADRATKVIRYDTGSFLPLGGALQTLAVDPRTFARAAFWDPSFANRPLQSLLDQLTVPSDPNAPVPVISVGVHVGPDGQLLLFGGNPFALPVRVVGFAGTFPGLPQNSPMILINQHVPALVDAPLHNQAPSRTEFWIRGDPEAALATLKRAGVPVSSDATLAHVTETASLAALGWVFGFLRALGVVTGLVALGGVLLYLAARQQSREVSYLLARRMGLSARSHRRSMGIELGGMLAIGFVIGAGLAWIGARVVYRRVDPLPQLPPAMLFRVPLALAAATVLALWLATRIGSHVVQRLAARADASAVLRVAG